MWFYSLLVLPKQITAIYLAGHVAQFRRPAVGHNHISFGFELRQVIDHPAVTKRGGVQGGFVDDDFDAFAFDALHDALDAAGAVVVAAGFHG